MKTYKQNETPEFEMIRAAAPEDDGARQYYFIEQAKLYGSSSLKVWQTAGRPQDAMRVNCF